jgi:deoxyribose-phosphate aldolase
VCVRPADVTRASRLLRTSSVLVGTVVGFPHGSSTTRSKVFETTEALEDGAREIDMVINIGWLRSGLVDRVAGDIAAVVDAARGRGLVKVIFETAYLDDAQIIAGCAAAVQAQADFVKTSTGFAPGGATLHHIRMMRANVPAHMRVKAAGGVRTLDVLLELWRAGATRFGATRTAEMLDDMARREAGIAPEPQSARVASAAADDY